MCTISKILWSNRCFKLQRRGYCTAAPPAFDGGLVAADMQLCALRYRQALAAQEGLPELTPESLTGQPGVGQSAAQVFHSVDERCKSYQH